MIQPEHSRHQRMCECGHKRQAHVDAYQYCDHCDCRRFRGPIDELSDTPYGLIVPAPGYGY